MSFTFKNSVLSTFVVLGMLGTTANANIICIDSVKTSYKLCEGAIKQSLEVSSKSEPKRVWKSAGEFWNANRDPIARSLNDKFIAAKKLRVDSKVSKSRTSVILTKEYTSYAALVEFRKEWKKSSPKGQSAEAKLVNYKDSDTFIF